MYISYIYIYKSDTFTIQSVPSHHHLQWSFLKNAQFNNLQGTAAQGLVLAARLASVEEGPGTPPPNFSWKKWRVMRNTPGTPNKQLVDG